MMGSSSLFFFVAKSSSPSSEKVEVKTKKAMKLSSHSTRSTRRNFGDLSLHREEGKEERDNHDNRLKSSSLWQLHQKHQKWSSTVFVSSWCFVACVLLPMHFSPPSPATASTMTMEEDSNISSMNNGKALFKGAGGCIGCHAAGGNIVEAGKTLSLQDLRKNGANGKEDVAEVISLGKNKMPGYGENCVGKGKCTFAKRLTEKEIDDLSAFVWNVANDESELSWAKALE
jgi:cytochrome c6